MKHICLCLFLALSVSGCMTQTIKLNKSSNSAGGKPAILIFPLSVCLKINGEDIVCEGGFFAVNRQVVLPPNEYDIQWEQSGRDYTFVYKGSGILKAESGQKYEIKTDKLLGYTWLSGTSINYKYMTSEVLDYATWIENTKTKEVVVGNKLLSSNPPLMRKMQDFCMIAMFSNNRGDYESAIENFQKALEIKPDLVVALNNLAWILATCKDERFRDPVSAIEYAKEACELSRYTVAGYIDTLAIAYAANGEFVKAKEIIQGAIDVAKIHNDRKSLEILQSRLELFEANKP